MAFDREQWLPPNGPLFHVRFIDSNCVEREQVLVGVRDGNGGFNIDVPTPYTLLSVKEHRFQFCEVCDAGRPLNKIREELKTETTPGTPADITQLFKSSEEYDAELIHVEVEAMDWPDTIGE